MLKSFTQKLIGIVMSLAFVSTFAQHGADFTLSINKYTKTKSINNLVISAKEKGVKLNISELKSNSRNQITTIKIVIANSESMDYYQSTDAVPIPTINIGQRNGVVFIDHKGQENTATTQSTKVSSSRAPKTGNRSQGIKTNSRRGSYANTNNKLRNATITDLMRDPRSAKKLVIVNGQQSSLQALVAYHRQGVKFEIDLLQPTNAMLLFGGNERTMNGAILASSLDEQ